jgi:hypothetical protein
MSMKNSMTPSGIEPETFVFVAQNLNHCDTAVPKNKNRYGIIETFATVSLITSLFWVYLTEI